MTTLAPKHRRAGGLDELLAEARRHSAEYPDVLANHLPMILVALHGLGASDDRLAEFFAAYRDRHGLVPAPGIVSALTRERWTDALGDRAREGDYRAFFDREVARLGIRDTLATYLPTLAPGVAASALHPLMRLSYGVLRRDSAEVAAGLGYWAASYLALPVSTGAPPVTDDPGEVLARVAAMPGLRTLPASDHLWYDMRAAAADRDFRPVVDWLHVSGDTLRRVAATALALYAGTMQFAALHALTGAHWVRLVATVCPESRLLRHFWQAVASLVPTLGFPTLPDAARLDVWRRLPCPDWPTITARATASDDEHDISLVFSARQEEQVYGDRLYRVVAARRVGLIA